jgi:hypothetical protein
MVPAAFVAMDEFPLTSSGKLDRHALPAPDYGAGPTARAPGSPREEVLCRLFGEVLGLGQPGADADFFTVGGDSILAASLVTRARAAGLEFTVQDVFEHRSVAELARAARAADPVSDPPPLPEAALVPLSPDELAWLEQDVDAAGRSSRENTATGELQ